MEVQKFSIPVGDKEITLEVGRFAQQAEAAVLAKCGGTVVHATIGLGGPSTQGWFPLSVEYMEKLFAGGKIKGSRWVKREGRPSDEAILSARVIDRSIRPMFPDGFMREVQVVATVLSVDGVNNPDMLALVASTAALDISSIPFSGPLAGLRIGYIPSEDRFTFNPTYEEQDKSILDLIVTGTDKAIVMVEAGANEVTEEKMLAALEAGHEQIKLMNSAISAMRQAIGKEKIEFVAPELDEALVEKIWSKHQPEMAQAVKAQAGLVKDDDTLSKLREKLIAEDESLADAPLGEIFHKLTKREARRRTFEEGMRPDDRKADEIRQISCEVDLLPTAHGSAMFQRGATQALTVTTLASPSFAQLIEDMEGEEEKRYIHHYEMPPFASGETGRLGWPKRREVGHGALAERALLPVIPSQDDFPYTIHVASMIMSSNGSTSQASVCGSTLSLMAAGVPIRKPVAGIAMGLMRNEQTNEYVILSDIQGLEDHIGDMDFKVAGTADGITAIQMDIKIDGIPMEVMSRALAQAKIGRMHIMEKMLACLAEPRQELAANAPKIETVQIPVSKIGELIGPGGKNIRSLQETTGTEISVDEDGRVTVASPDQAAIAAAAGQIRNMMMEFEPGMEFDGEITRIEDYGAFVELTPGRDGLVHVSQMATGYVRDPREVAKLGDRVHVEVLEVDGDRIRLTMLSKEQREEAEAQRKERQSSGGDRGDRGHGGHGGGRSDFRRSGGRGGDRRGGGGYRGDRG
jgi:polyribonucleotide nucleotidyltransferase